MSYFVDIHTHKPESEGLFIFNIPSDRVFSFEKYNSYGIHPWDITKVNIDGQIEMLKSFFNDKKLVAVGEIGLDRAIQTDLEIQKKFFIKQLDIAKQFQLPVIIHCVRAWSDILSVRKSGRYTDLWIFHGFTGTLETALQITKSGCYLSFGKALISNTKLQKVIKKLPLQHIFFETDDSDCKIEEIYQKASEILDICEDELKEIVYINFQKVFVR